jgi:dihydroorotase-like cyclic amidohydrolase
LFSLVNSKLAEIEKHLAFRKEEENKLLILKAQQENALYEARKLKKLDEEYQRDQLRLGLEMKSYVDAKKQDIKVTCETGPHYLVLNDMQLQEDGRFKMNPPIRAEEDRQALIEGIKDGTIDMIITDHAPHSKEEKSKGLEGSAMGIVGIETAFPILYTKLIKEGVITLEKLIELMSINPRKRFGLPETEDYCVYDLEKSYIINPDEFLSKGRSTPFAGWEVNGKCLLTVCDGKVVWQHPDFSWKDE